MNDPYVDRVSVPTFVAVNDDGNKVTTDAVVTRRVQPRVQRLVDRLQPVHLEAVVPTYDADWTVTVDGLVETPIVLSLEGLREMGAQEQVIDFHCVWGWSKPRCRWTGISVERVLALAGIPAEASVVTVACRNAPYASCLHIDDARAGMLAWALDGEDLTPDHGWPVRFVPPNWLWAYKGVKWAARLTVGDVFRAGFWEEKVGDVEGRIPPDQLVPFTNEEF